MEDPSWQIALEEAQYEDPDFQVGDMLEEEVPFVDFGRLAVQAAKQRIIQRVREGELRAVFGDPGLLRRLTGGPQETDYPAVTARIWHDAEACAAGGLRCTA